MNVRHTRRELIAAGAAAAAGSAVWAGAAGAAAAAGGDRALLARTLEAERLVVWCYERVLETGLLAPAALSAASLLLEHEHEHVSTLERLLGSPASARPLTPVRARRELASHQVSVDPVHLRTEHDGLRLLVDAESIAEEAWFATIGKLADGAAALLGAQIMACEAQHWTVLSGLAHHENVKLAVPYPFVRGSSGY